MKRPNEVNLELEDLSSFYDEQGLSPNTDTEKYINKLEQRLEAGQHETIVMWRKPDEELPTDGQEVLFAQGNDIIRGYFSKPRSFFGPSGYNVNGVNGNHQIDKWVPVAELL